MLSRTQRLQEVFEFLESEGFIQSTAVLRDEAAWLWNHAAPGDEPESRGSVQEFLPSESTPTPASLEAWHRPPGLTNMPGYKIRLAPLKLYVSMRASVAEDRILHQRKGTGTSRSKVVFHDPPTVSEEKANQLRVLSLRMLYNPLVNGLEDTPDLAIVCGSTIAGR